MLLPRRKDGLDTHHVDDEFVLYEAAGDAVHYLNPTALLILEFCDGEHSPEQIAELVREAYGLPEAPVTQVTECLATLQQSGLLVE